MIVTITLTLTIGGVEDDYEASAEVLVRRDCIGRYADIEDEPLVNGAPMSQLALSAFDEARIFEALCDAALEG